MNGRESFRYSIMCRSAEEAVLHCLKALADFAENGGHKHDGSLEAAVAEWDRHDRVILRFTTPAHRDAFRRMARDLLHGRWAEYAARDDDPPPPLAPRADDGDR